MKALHTFLFCLLFSYSHAASWYVSNSPQLQAVMTNGPLAGDTVWIYDMGTNYVSPCTNFGSWGHGLIQPPTTSPEFGAFVVQGSVGLLNVNDYGAIGDATNFTANCVSNSAIIHTSIALPTNSAWAIQVIGAGTNTFGSTTNSDFLGWITNVVNGTNIYADRACRWTTNLAQAFAGTFCSTGIQACVNAAIGGDTIDFPPGKYFTFSSQFMSQSYISGGDYGQIGAVYISTNGLKFLGHPGTSLVGLGAFVHSASWTNVHRGFMFYVAGPVANPSATLTFQDLTLDGGVLNPTTSNHGFPANNVNGDGWDVTDGAIFVHAPSQSSADFIYPTNVVITGCTIKNWRGEMLKTGSDFQTANFFALTNDLFLNGNASAWNMGYAHAIHGCTFSNVYEGGEVTESEATIPMVFESNIITNCFAGWSIVGASTNRQPQSAYLFQSNVVNTTSSGINLSPAQNVTIRGNDFNNTDEGLLIGGVGTQGSAMNSNIAFYGNTVKALNMIVNHNSDHVYVTNNIFTGNNPASSTVAYDDIVAGAFHGNWFLYNNTASNSKFGVNATAATVFPYDDLSNAFPWNVLNDFKDSNLRISYSYGARQVQTDPTFEWGLEYTEGSKMLDGDQMIVSNACGISRGYALDASRSVTLPNNSAFQVWWYSGQWNTNAPPPPPPVSGGTITVLGTLHIGP